MSAPPPPVHLVRGSDPVLVDHAVGELVVRLVGDADRSLTVDELTAASYDPSGTGEVGVGPIVDACATPPFLTDRRVVVARQAGVLGGAGGTDRFAPLVAYLADPLPTSALVLVWEKATSSATLATPPKKLVDAVKACGGEVVNTEPAPRAREAWIDEHVEASGLRLAPAARRLIAGHVGEEVNRLFAILTTLRGAYGPGASLGVDEVRPLLGEAGGVAPWELTDRIDKGDVAGSLEVLERMMAGGDRHPLQILATLHGHYARMLRLDGVPVGDEKAAAELLGMRGSTFPAKKAMTQGRRLGSARLAEFTGLLAAADLDLRGARQIDPSIVMEVLVARLASRSRR